MNIRHLQYFQQLAKLQHFAKAAKACHVTQPTLSAGISALEKSLGLELVVRQSQFVALTDAGDIVLQYAEKMLQEQAALKQELSLFSGQMTGSLDIGIVPQSSVDIMPLIKRFNQAFPHININLSVMTNSQLIESLTLHKTDIGLGFDEHLTEVNRRSFVLYPQRSLAHSNCPAHSTNHAQSTNPAYSISQMALLCAYIDDHIDDKASQKSVSLASLSNTPLVLLSKGMQFRQYIDQAMAEVGGEFKVVLETDSLFHLISAVKHGIGSAIVSLGIAESVSQLFGINYQALEGIKSGSTVFITRKHSLTPAMKAFTRLLEGDE
ncbi:LysR family transcriptional regulator [Shewanella acanthi]|uniref:LysR family transcriptional regulator n=1 Tax=Shewanella acanthi TaxID=2864212 RepID=UPI001C65B77D|nr:LysR family transcriptional regulator [Shewanella acanthi]QYJ80288.1 LysR family transcriptional regulator [Shewanella acanthi]